MPDKVDSARAALPLGLASIPDPVTPAAGHAAAQAALDDADAVLTNIKLKFAGTLPPPPWPATPEVQKAVDEMQIERDGFATLEARQGGIVLSWPRNTGKFGPALIRVGTTLYTRLAELEGAAAKSDSLPDMIKRLGELPKPLAVPLALFGLGLGLMALREVRGFRRLVEGN